MDFDKLKKAASNTIKAVSGKLEDFSSDIDSAADTPKSSENHDEIFDDFSDFIPDEDIKSGKTGESDDAAQTQRFNLQNMLERFRQRRDDLDGTFRDIFGSSPAGSAPHSNAAENVRCDVAAGASENKTSDAQSQSAEDEISGSAINESLSELSERLSELNELNEKGATDTAAISAQLIELSEQITALNELAKEDNAHIRKAVDNINGNFNVTDKKLTDITNSLASISKLNDSIFDLKNAQMNTKNSLGDLEASFYKLKKKMSTSVLIISILTAIIVILEIINLLS